FDASAHVVIPGLINTHHHFYQTLTRACPPALDKELFSWLKALYPIWAHLDSAMLEVATELALAELLLSGCTCTADHHYIVSQHLPDAFDRQVRAATKLGMRVLITRGSMSLSVEDGGLPPKSVVQDAESIMADCVAVAERYHQSHEGAFVHIGMAPCSPFSVDLGLMQETAAEAKRLGLRLHTHLAETHDENNYCQAKYGCRPLELLDKTGWLGDQTWLAHGIHFTDDEIKALGQAGTGIAHCPGSNLMLASGTCAAHDLERHGAPVGIGVDGSASEDASNLIEEVRRAWQVQRLRYGAAKISHKDVLRWATLGSACCLGRDDIGSIAPGKQADLAL
ncbi:MAG: amidohydrolase family protein, partial [Pseudomonadota bacterium]